MIQEHTARMEQYLTPEERFIQAVLQNNRPVLEQMKNEDFTPSSRLLESVAANHPTADYLDTLHSTFVISLPSMEAESAMKNMNELQLGLYTFKNYHYVYRTNYRLCRCGCPAEQKWKRIQLPCIHQVLEREQRGTDPMGMLFRELRKYSL